MRQIGNYTVEEKEIGSGGMGRVLRGVSPDGSVPVAIKEILPEFVSDIEYRSRIESEIAFLKMMNNENVVKVYDHFQLNGNLYIVMELVEGLNIEEYVRANGPIPWADALGYMNKLLPTMQYVHENGIVHRDIKPGNIMIRPDGNICLLDFGVAKNVSANAGGGTVVGTIIGTDGYMSPEQADGMSIDHRSDIYALGCVLFFMLTGSHAFERMGSDLEMQLNILRNPFPKLASRINGVPDSVQALLDHAVDKNMMRRFQSCREFASELQKLLPGGTLIKKSVNIQEISVSVGRENCDICLGMENFKVSRHHADITRREFTGGSYYIYTDCSSNGTVINGQSLGRGMSYNIPVGKNPTILLAGEMDCRLDMREVDRIFRAKLQMAESNAHDSIPESTGVAVQPGTIQSVHSRPLALKAPDDSFGAAVKTCLSKYAVFKGRASKSEYWWFYLFQTILSVAGALAFIMSGFEMGVLAVAELIIFGFCGLPGLAVFIRRLHDTGKGWGLFFCTLIPIYGIWAAIDILIRLFTKGIPGPNKYGPGPGLSYK